VPYRRKKLTFAISSPDEFLSLTVLMFEVQQYYCCHEHDAQPCHIL